MSEVRKNNDSIVRNEPEVFSDLHPDPGPQVSGPEARMDSAPATEIPPGEISGITRFCEKSASLALKLFLVALTVFAAGAALAIMVLMDLLDHKSGWLKELLQFIKEALKIVTK